MNFSKSKYTQLWQCPKSIWMRKYMPDKAETDENVKKRMLAGNEVGDLAMQLFGEYVEVTSYDGDKINLSAMIEKTKEELKKGTENICEASFEYKGLYCAVDILKKTEKGYAIYEVKSSTYSEHDDKDPKDIYIADVAYQKYVLEHCGINVTDTFLVMLNKDYVFEGSLELSKLFIIENINDLIQNEDLKVFDNLRIAETILSNDEEPNIDIDCRCNKPYKCAFWKYCSRHLPSPSVFDLYRMRFSQKIEYYKDGLVSYKDILNSGKVDHKIRLLQMDHVVNGLNEASIDKQVLQEFLDTITYPLYHLDFETEQPVIPKYIGTHPYQQIPFQYSLHIEQSDGHLEHKEFLAESGPDPRRAIAESLVENIPTNVCVMAYNKTFECTRLTELAETFPDLASHLLSIRDNIVDLVVPFRTGGYYTTAMGGSFSIKSVLPALFPDDPDLNYHALEDVHNGSEAMEIFPLIQNMNQEDRDKARSNLLKYCCLDTLAMVKILSILKAAVK